MTNIDNLLYRKLMEGNHYPAPYSTDITSAWLVVDQMVRNGWQVSLNLSCEGEWLCSFGRSVTDWTGEQATAETAPQAICLAALAALDRTPDSGSGKPR